MKAAKHAQIDDRKLIQYLLSAEHPVGRAKARFFLALGFSPKAPDLLRLALLRHARKCEVSFTVETHFGTKYVLDGGFSGPNGSYSTLRSVWLVAVSDGHLRFVTAYPLRRRQA